MPPANYPDWLAGYADLLLERAGALLLHIQEGHRYVARAERTVSGVLTVRLVEHRAGIRGLVLTESSTAVEVAAGLLQDLEHRYARDPEDEAPPKAKKRMGMFADDAEEEAEEEFDVAAVQSERLRVLAERTERDRKLAKERDASGPSLGRLTDGGSGSKRHGRHYL